MKIPLSARAITLAAGVPLIACIISLSFYLANKTLEVFSFAYVGFEILATGKPEITESELSLRTGLSLETVENSVLRAQVETENLNRLISPTRICQAKLTFDVLKSKTNFVLRTTCVWFAIIIILGSCVLYVRNGVSRWNLSADNTKSLRDWVDRKFSKIPKGIGISHGISTHVGIRFFKPILVLNDEALLSKDPKRTEFKILHELAHIFCGHSLLQSVGAVLKTLMPFIIGLALFQGIAVSLIRSGIPLPVIVLVILPLITGGSFWVINRYFALSAQVYEYQADKIASLNLPDYQFEPDTKNHGLWGHGVREAFHKHGETPGFVANISILAASIAMLLYPVTSLYSVTVSSICFIAIFVSATCLTISASVGGVYPSKKNWGVFVVCCILSALSIQINPEDERKILFVVYLFIPLLFGLMALMLNLNRLIQKIR